MGIYETILSMNSGLLVFLLALVVNVFSTLVYKKVTDQKEIKKLKAKQKEMQKEVKKLQDQPDKAMKKQKEMMEISGKLMKQSFKPMIYTMIPLLLLFGWINSALIYDSLGPGEPFLVTATFEENFNDEVTLSYLTTSENSLLEIDDATKMAKDNQIIWKLSGDAGKYELKFESESFDLDESLEYKKSIVITEEKKYENPLETYDGTLKSVEIGNKRIRPFGGLNFFGWYPGMIGAYIILSIILSIGMRRALGVA